MNLRRERLIIILFIAVSLAMPYDLGKIVRTEELVDQLYKEFFRLFESKYPVNY